VRSLREKHSRVDRSELGRGNRREERSWGVKEITEHDNRIVFRTLGAAGPWWVVPRTFTPRGFFGDRLTGRSG
jgi:hypothetical protein